MGVGRVWTYLRELQLEFAWGIARGIAIPDGISSLEHQYLEVSSNPNQIWRLIL